MAWRPVAWRPIRLLWAQTAVVDEASLRVRALVYEVLVRRLLLRTPSPMLLFLSWDRIGWCANLESNPLYASRCAPPGGSSRRVCLMIGSPLWA